MTGFPTPQAAVNEFVRLLSEELGMQLKLLLEERHLYQKVSVNPDVIASEVVARTFTNMQGEVAKEIGALRNARFGLGTSMLTLVPRSGSPSIVPHLLINNVRLFCATCNERLIFSPVWYRDVSNELLLQAANGGERVEVKGDLDTNQLIFLAFQCQNCKGIPEGFLVRRVGWRLSLEGRSPMENILLPSFIPKPEGNLFRDALISWHAGKKLAAVFYLRAFIEQFARRQAKMINERRTGDEIMDAYAQTLLPDKRQMMPSLKEWYDKLSVPIHAADENAAEGLFDTAREAIEQHFEIRRVFKIPDAQSHVAST